MEGDDKYDEDYLWREHFRMRKHDVYWAGREIDEDTRKKLNELGVSVNYKEGNLVSVNARLEGDVYRAAEILCERGMIHRVIEY